MSYAHAPSIAAKTQATAEQWLREDYARACRTIAAQRFSIRELTIQNDRLRQVAGPGADDRWDTLQDERATFLDALTEISQLDMGEATCIARDALGACPDCGVVSDEGPFGQATGCSSCAVGLDVAA